MWRENWYYYPLTDEEIRLQRSPRPDSWQVIALRLEPRSVYNSGSHFIRSGYSSITFFQIISCPLWSLNWQETNSNNWVLIVHLFSKCAYVSRYVCVCMWLCIFTHAQKEIKKTVSIGPLISCTTNVRIPQSSPMVLYSFISVIFFIFMTWHTTSILIKLQGTCWNLRIIFYSSVLLSQIQCPLKLFHSHFCYSSIDSNYHIPAMWITLCLTYFSSHPSSPINMYASLNMSLP